MYIKPEANINYIAAAPLHLERSKKCNLKYSNRKPENRADEEEEETHRSEPQTEDAPLDQKTPTTTHLHQGLDPHGLGQRVSKVQVAPEYLSTINKLL
jgi:hypothetical protein